MPKESPARSSVGRISHIPRSRIRSSSCDSKSLMRTTNKSMVESVRHVSVSPKRNNKRSVLSESKTSIPKMSLGKTPQKQSRSSTTTPGKNRHNATIMQNATKDIRPLQDKIYQTEMINMIEQFFQDINQAHLLNNSGSLRPMSLKIFVDVSNVLLQIINISEPLTVSNYIDLVPIIAKKLRYPAVVNKSWLKTANVTHSLPNVLGWLSWLTAVASAKIKAEKNFQMNNMPFEEERATNRRRFNIIMECYEAWNDEKISDEERILNNYFKNEEKVLGVTEYDLQEAEKKVEENRKKLLIEENILKRISKDNTELTNTLKLLEKNEDEQNKFFETGDKDMEHLNKINEQVLEDINILINEKNKEDKDCKTLEVNIAKQPMSADQRDKKLQIIADNKDCISQLDKNLDEIHKQQYTIDMKLSKLNKNMTEHIDKYRSIIYNEMNKNVHDVKIDMASLAIPVLSTNNSSMFNTIQEKYDMICQIETSLKTELETMQTQIESLYHQIEAMKDEKNRLSLCRQKDIEFQKQIEDNMQNMKQKFTEKEMEIEKSIYELNQQKKSIVDAAPNLDLLVADLKETENKMTALYKRKTFLEERVKSFFTKFMSINNEHKDEMDRMLNEL